MDIDKNGNNNLEEEIEIEEEVEEEIEANSEEENNGENVIQKDTKTTEEKLIEIFKDDKILKLIDDNNEKGFIELNNYITNNKIQENNFDTIFIYIINKLNNFTESNNNILKEGIQCIINLFKQGTSSFQITKNYINLLLPNTYDKIIDNNLKDAYLDLLDILQKIYSYKILLDELFNILLNINNQEILKAYAIYIENLIENNLIIRIVNDFIEENVNIKKLIDFNIYLINNFPEIQKISIEIFMQLYKYLGPELKLFLKEIKNESTIKLIESEINNHENLPENDKIIRTDISDEMPPSLLKEIDKGSWNDKKDGIEYIHNLIIKAKNKISINGLNELFNLINDKLKDSNKNFVKLILELLLHLIDALDTQIKNFSFFIIENLLLILNDKNKTLRDESLKCIKQWIKYQNFEIFAGFFPEHLSTGGYEIKIEILNLLIEYKEMITVNYRPKFFEDLLKSLLICLQDKNNIIRNKTEFFIKNFKLIKKEDYIKQIKEFKPAISEYLLNIMDNIFPTNEKKIKKVAIKKEINEKRNNKSKRKNYCNSLNTSKNKRKNIKLSINNINKSSQSNNPLFTTTYKVPNKNNSFRVNPLTTFNKPSRLISYEQTMKNNQKRKKYINLNFKKHLNSSLDLGNGNNKINNYKKVLGMNKPMAMRLNISAERRPRNNKVNRMKLNNVNINISSKKMKIFSKNYIFKQGVKIKRCGIAIKNMNETHPADLLMKIRESAKNVFSTEFLNKILSNDISNVINCIKLLTDYTKIKPNSKNSKSCMNFDKVTENFDIILKIFKFNLLNNQSLSLIKNIIEFCELIIKTHIKKDMKLTDVEITLLLNIFSEKLIYANNKISNDFYNLIFELIKISENPNKFFLILLTAFNENKNNNIKIKLLEIIINLTQKIDLISNTESSKQITKNLIHIFFDYPENKIKLIEILKNIYLKIGKEEFKKRIPNSLNNKQKEELLFALTGGKEKTKNEDDIINKGEMSSIIKDSDCDNSKMFSSDKTILNNFVEKVKYSNNDLGAINLSSIKKNNKSEKGKINTKISISEKQRNIRNNNPINIKKINEINKNLFNKYIKKEVKKPLVKYQKTVTNKTPQNNDNNKNIIKVNISNNNLISNSYSDRTLTNEKLEEILNNLTTSTTQDKLLESFIDIHEMIYYNFQVNKNIIIPYTDIIFEAFITLIQKNTVNLPNEILSLKNITNIFCLLCSIKELLSSISYNTEIKLINLILIIVTNHKIKYYGNNKEGMIIWRSFNSIMLRIIDSCDANNTIKIFLREIIVYENKNEYVDYYLRCLLIINKNIKDVIINMKIGEVLYEISLLLNNCDSNINIIKVIHQLVEGIVNIRKEKIILDYKEVVCLYKEGGEIDDKGKKIKNLINEILVKIGINEVIEE